MKITKKQSNKGKTGTVLPFTVIVVVLLLLIGLGLSRLGLSARVQAAKSTADLSARAAADAGITQARRFMNKKLADELNWDNSELPTVTGVQLPNSYANYSFDVDGNPTNGFLIASIGRSGVVQRKVYAKLGVDSLWTGIGVKEGVDIKVGATFATDPPGGDFSIRTNSTQDSAISLKQGIVIPGDVIVGPGGDPDKVITDKATTTIEGDVYVAEEEIAFPPVTVPGVFSTIGTTGYAYTPSVHIGDPNSADVKYFKLDTLQIPQSGVQEIRGHCVIYVEDKTILGQAAELIVMPGSSLTLYLGGDMEAKNSNGIDNLTGDATALKIFGTDNCEHIDLKAKGDVFFGAVYAPNADMDVYAKNELAGAFVGKSFNLKNSTKFTFVSELMKSDINDEQSYLMQRWWEE